jgi:hypothetical protein
VNIYPVARKRLIRAKLLDVASAPAHFKSKGTAAQIKLFFSGRYSALKGWHNPAIDVFATPHGLHNTRIPQDAKMF